MGIVGLVVGLIGAAIGIAAGLVGGLLGLGAGLLGLLVPLSPLLLIVIGIVWLLKKLADANYPAGRPLPPREGPGVFEK